MTFVCHTCDLPQQILSDLLIHVRENPAHSFYFPVLIYSYCLHRGQEVF